MTVFLFPFDDLATMENLEHIVRQLADGVDFIIVRNPAKNQTRMYDGSGLQSALADWGAVEITMPALFRSTLLQLDELEARHKRGITWAEAIGNRNLKLDLFARGDLESFLRDIYVQYDAIAGHLLPTDAAAQIQPPKVPPADPQQILQGGFNFSTE